MNKQLVLGRPNVATRFVFAVASVATSAAVLGSVLGAFEIQGRDAALARAAAPTLLAAAAPASRVAAR